MPRSRGLSPALALLRGRCGPCTSDGLAELIDNVDDAVDVTHQPGRNRDEVPATSASPGPASRISSRTWRTSAAMFSSGRRNTARRSRRLTTPISLLCSSTTGSGLTWRVLIRRPAVWTVTCGPTVMGMVNARLSLPGTHRFHRVQTAGDVLLRFRSLLGDGRGLNDRFPGPFGWTGRRDRSRAPRNRDPREAEPSLSRSPVSQRPQGFGPDLSGRWTVGGQIAARWNWVISDTPRKGRLR